MTLLRLFELKKWQKSGLGGRAHLLHHLIILGYFGEFQSTLSFFSSLRLRFLSYYQKPRKTQGMEKGSFRKKLTENVKK